MYTAQFTTNLPDNFLSCLQATRKLEPIAKPVTLPPPSLPVETDGNQSTSTQVQSGLASIKDPPEPTESKEAGQKPKSRVLRLANMVRPFCLGCHVLFDPRQQDLSSA